MKALLLGSTGVVAEVSRLQRLAYNTAFQDLEVDIHWNVATYSRLLGQPGALHALDSLLGDEAPVGLAEEIKAAQQRHFATLISDGIEPRPGIRETLAYCRAQGIRTAWVTGAAPELVEALLGALRGVDAEDFELITTLEDPALAKPSPKLYAFALTAMKLSAADCVALEESPVHQTAALQAGIQCYLYPGDYADTAAPVSITRDPLETVRSVHTLWETGVAAA